MTKTKKKGQSKKLVVKGATASQIISSLKLPRADRERIERLAAEIAAKTAPARRPKAS